MVASLVSLWDAENKSCLSSAQLALFPLFRVKGADVEGWVGKCDWHCGYTGHRERKSLPQTMEDVYAHCPDIVSQK